MNTKTKLTIALILSLITILMTPIALARKPAVEPVSGISIDNYKQITPDGVTKGIDLTQNQPNVINEKSDRGIELPGWIGIFFLGALPLFIYVALSRFRSRPIDQTTNVIPLKPDQKDQTEKKKAA